MYNYKLQLPSLLTNYYYYYYGTQQLIRTDTDRTSALCRTSALYYVVKGCSTYGSRGKGTKRSTETEEENNTQTKKWRGEKGRRRHSERRSLSLQLQRCSHGGLRAPRLSAPRRLTTGGGDFPGGGAARGTSSDPSPSRASPGQRWPRTGPPASQTTSTPRPL